jgi:tellurite resistance protein
LSYFNKKTKLCRFLKNAADKRARVQEQINKDSAFEQHEQEIAKIWSNYARQFPTSPRADDATLLKSLNSNKAERREARSFFT